MNRNVIAQRLVDIADELDSLGLIEEANEVDSIVQAMVGGGMQRTAQGSALTPAQSEYWRKELPREFSSPSGKTTGSGMAGGGEYNQLNSLDAILGGGGERFKLWKNQVWDKMSPDQQEQFRNKSKMGSWAKPLNQELYDNWSTNIAPTMSKEYYGQASDPDANTAGAGAGTGAGARSQDYNQLDRQIDATRKELIRLQQSKQQMLQGTKGYTGGADYSRMMQPVQQQHL